MTQSEILEEIKKLSLKDRIEVIDATIHLLRDELMQRAGPATPEDRRRLLSQAAHVLLHDYEIAGELTIFSALDGEDLHA